MFALVLAAAQQQIIHVDTATLSIVAGLIIPLLVASLAKAKASSTVKALLNAVLVAIGGGVALLLANHGSLPVRELLASIAVAFIVSGAAYQHLWKPLGWADAIRAYFPGGIGTEQPPHGDGG